MEIKSIEFYTRDLVRANPASLFLFGDNLARWGTGGQAIIRGLKNTHGIATKKHPSYHSNSFFTDNEYEQNCEIIKNDIDSIPWQYFNVLCFPTNGFGTGMSAMPEKCPKTFNFLNEYFAEFLKSIKQSKEAIL